MKRQQLTRQQFDRLYDRFLPRMYEAALCLLGDREEAAAAAQTAWLSAAAADAVPDERTFGVNAARLLVEACSGARHRAPYRLNEMADTRSGRTADLVRYLSALDFDARCLVVLAAVQNYQPCEIARILHRPEWMVTRRLAALAGRAGVCGRQPARSF